jgi:hypothetical protein
LAAAAGNEFGFVMANLSHERDVIALAQRMLDAITVPFTVISGQCDCYHRQHWHQCLATQWLRNRCGAVEERQMRPCCVQKRLGAIHSAFIRRKWMPMPSAAWGWKLRYVTRYSTTN